MELAGVLSVAISDQKYRAVSYEYEDQEIECGIARAATNEKVILIEAVAFSTWSDLVPSVVDGLTIRVSASMVPPGVQSHTTIGI